MTDTLERFRAALADRYTIERELGSGATATVYLARDLKHERQVALKVLSPELAAALGRDRFLQEIKIAANLHHPHILALYDSGEADGYLYYVMPFAEGESLRDRLRREKQLSIDDALQIAREVADALSYAHSHGVIHRDIKPENILLESGHAVVADFGIARAIDAAGGERLTETGIAVGTPQYMSPEQAAGEKELDGRSDLYSLGCVLHEMLAGQPPFTGPTVESVVLQHLSAEPPSVTVIRPAVPGWVAAALERSLAKTPADRFNPVALFGEAISPRAAVTAGARVADPRGRRRWLVPGFLATVTLVVVAVLLYRVLTSGPLSVTTSNIMRVTTDPGLEFQPALSPDGSEVAYVVGPISNPRITVRGSIDAGTGGESRVSEGVNGFHWLPEWTPDGDRIRFVNCAQSFAGSIPRACGEWKEVEKFGGPVHPVELARPSNSLAFSRDGSRVAFAVGDSLFGWSVADGEPRLLGIHPDSSLQPHSLAWSPDGKLIAYVAGNSSWRTGVNIATASVWMLDTIGGAPVQVTDQESMNLSPQWLPDSRHLLFVSDRDGARGIYVVEIGPDGATGPPASIPGSSDPHSISVSADGKRLAYARLPAKQNIWSIPIPESGVASIRDAVQITSVHQIVESHSVSSDGEWIVFDSKVGRDADIYRQRIAGGNQELVALIEGNQFYPSWSPDGTEIAYYTEGAGIRVMSSSGGSAEQLPDLPGRWSRPDWSPDGLSIAYQRQLPDLSIWIASRAGPGAPWGEPKPLTAFGDCQNAQWAPDGLSLICYTLQEGLVRVSRSGEVLWRYDPSIDGLQRRGGFLAPRFSPDGARIYGVATEEDGSRGVWWIPADGGNATKVVAFDDPSVFVPGFLSVGQNDFFLTIAEYESDIYVMDLEW